MRDAEEVLVERRAVRERRVSTMWRRLEGKGEEKGCVPIDEHARDRTDVTNENLVRRSRSTLGLRTDVLGRPVKKREESARNYSKRLL